MVGESCYELGSPVVLGKRCRACSALEPKEIGQQYERLFTIGKELLAEWDMDRLLSEAIDRLIEISSAERGMIILFDEDGEIFFERARNLKKEDIARWILDENTGDWLFSDWSVAAGTHPGSSSEASLNDLEILIRGCALMIRDNHSGMERIWALDLWNSGNWRLIPPR